MRRIPRISLEAILFLGESECLEEVTNGDDGENAVANQRAVLYTFTYFRAILSGCVSFLAATPCPHLPQVGVDGAICCLPLRATCIPAPYHPVHAAKTDPSTSIAPPVLCLIDQQAFFAAVIRQSCYKPRPALPPPTTCEAGHTPLPKPYWARCALILGDHQARCSSHPLVCRRRRASESTRTTPAPPRCRRCSSPSLAGP